MVVNPKTFMIPRINKDKCTGCGLCEDACPGKCITINNDGYAEIDIFYCENCGICSQLPEVYHPVICPEAAAILPWDDWQQDFKITG